jgi:hypothetical protein
MSSTGRGEKLDKSGLDDYPTPRFCVDRLMEVWAPNPGIAVEPCAGNGDLIRAVQAHCPMNWLAIEIQEKYEVPLTQTFTDLELHKSSFHIGDFFSAQTNCIPVGPVNGHGYRPRKPISAVISNPPYCLAQEFLTRCLILYPEAEVCFLLRVGFLESEKRLGMWEHCGIPDLYILPNRPSFRPSIDEETGKEKKGSTDSSTYAWMVWPPQRRTEGQVRILGGTSKEEKRREM